MSEQPSSLPAEFTPLQRSSRSQRLLVMLFGPLLWLAALVVVGVVVERRNAVEFGLVVTVLAFVAALGISLLACLLRRREEREAAE